MTQAPSRPVDRDAAQRFRRQAWTTDGFWAAGTGDWPCRTTVAAAGQRFVGHRDVVEARQGVEQVRIAEEPMSQKGHRFPGPHSVGVAAPAKDDLGVLFNLAQQQSGEGLVRIDRQHRAQLVARVLGLAAAEQGDGVRQAIGYADRMGRRERR